MSKYTTVRPHFVHYPAYNCIKIVPWKFYWYFYTFETNYNVYKALMQIQIHLCRMTVNDAQNISQAALDFNTVLQTLEFND